MIEISESNQIYTEQMDQEILELPPPVDPKVLSKAATKIQSLWRGFTARKEKKLTLKAIVMIQRVFKGFKARQQYKKLLLEARWLKDTPISTGPTLNIIKKTSGIAGRKRPTRGHKVVSKEVVSTSSTESEGGESNSEGGDGESQTPSQPKATLIGGMGMPAIPKFDPSQIMLKARPRLKEDRHSIADMSSLTNKIPGNQLSNSADSTPISSPLNLRKTVLLKTNTDSEGTDGNSESGSPIKPEPQPFFSPQLLRKAPPKSTPDLPPLDQNSPPSFPSQVLLKKKATSFLHNSTGSFNSTPDLSTFDISTIPPPITNTEEDKTPIPTIAKPKLPVLKATSFLKPIIPVSESLPKPIIENEQKNIIPPLPKVESPRQEDDLLPPIFGTPPPIPTDFNVILPPPMNISTLPPPITDFPIASTINIPNLPPPITNTPSSSNIQLPSIKPPSIPNSNRPITTSGSIPPPLATPGSIPPPISSNIPPIPNSNRPISTSGSIPPPLTSSGSIPPPFSTPPPITKTPSISNLPPPLTTSGSLPPPITSNIPPQIPMSNRPQISNIPPPLITKAPSTTTLPPPVMNLPPSIPSSNRPQLSNIPPISTTPNLPPPITSSGSLPPPITSDIPPPIINSLPSSFNLPPPISSVNSLPPITTLPGSLPPPITSNIPPPISNPPPITKTPPTFNLPPPISTPPPITKTPSHSTLPPPMMSTPPLSRPNTNILPPTMTTPPPISKTPSHSTLPPPNFTIIPSPITTPPPIAKTQPSSLNLPPPFGSTLNSTPSSSSSFEALLPPMASTPAPKMIRQIKDGWKEYITPDGKKYYHHRESNTTTWSENDAYIMVPENLPVSPSLPPPISTPTQPPTNNTSNNNSSSNNNNPKGKNEWVEMRTKEGILYYYNAATDTTKWTKPVDIQADPHEKKRVGGVLSKFLKKRPSKNELVKKNILQDDIQTNSSNSKSKSKKK